MTRKFAVAVGLAAAMAIPTVARAQYVAGEWFDPYWAWGSITWNAQVAKISGKELNLGIFSSAELKFTAAATLCANPNGYSVVSGNGPRGASSGTSTSPLNDGDVIKDKVKGNLYNTNGAVTNLVSTATRLNPPSEVIEACKKSGGTTWIPVYWQDNGCVKGLSAKGLAEAEANGEAVCYSYNNLAVYINNYLTYASGPKKGQRVDEFNPGCNGPALSRDPALCPNWTFVYLPTAFAYKLFLDISSDDEQYSKIFGACSFGTGPKGKPLSLTNPPAGGWAVSPPPEYVCQAKDEAFFNAL